MPFMDPFAVEVARCAHAGFDLQMQLAREGRHDIVYLWMLPASHELPTDKSGDPKGRLQISTDCPGAGWELASSEGQRGALERGQLTRWVFNLAVKLPILPWTVMSDAQAEKETK